MKKTCIGLLTTFSLILLTIHSLQAQIQTPQASPTASISQAIGLGTATINYSRPSLKGRQMFGKQLPFGDVWRTGANAVTTIEISEEMSFMGTSVPAGIYGLLSIPGEEEWTIILNQDSKQWGAYTYQKEKDVLRFKVKPVKTKEKTEHLTIGFTTFTPTSATLTIAWENFKTSFEISQNPEKQIMTQIDATLAKSEVSANDYLSIANYYYETGKSKDKTYEYSKKAAEMNPKYWSYFVFARAAATVGKCDEAVKAAEKGLTLAKESGDMAYVINNQSVIDSCKK